MRKYEKIENQGSKLQTQKLIVAIVQLIVLVFAFTMLHM